MSQASAFHGNHLVSFGQPSVNHQQYRGNQAMYGLPDLSVESYAVSAPSSANGQFFLPPHTLANVQHSNQYVSQPNTYSSTQTFGQLGPSITRLNDGGLVQMQKDTYSETRLNPQQLNSALGGVQRIKAQGGHYQAASQPIIGFREDPSQKTVGKSPIRTMPSLTVEDTLQVKLFLSLVLNMVNDQKLKDQSRKSRSVSRGGQKSASKNNQENLQEKKLVGLSKEVLTTPDGKNITATISMLEHSLNELEKHNHRLVKENESLTNKLRGVEEVNKLAEDPNWVQQLKSSSNLSSLNSPFFKANTAMRAKSGFYRKGSRDGHTYSDKVHAKIQQSQRNTEISSQIQELTDQNSVLRAKTTTYESEINELYQRIDKFDTLESSVAELIQENERLRGVIMKITGQVQHNF